MECTLRCGIIHEGYLAWRQHNEPPMKAQLRLNRDAINSFIQSFFLHFTVHTFGLLSKKHMSCDKYDLETFILSQKGGAMFSGQLFN